MNACADAVADAVAATIFIMIFGTLAIGGLFALGFVCGRLFESRKGSRT